MSRPQPVLARLLALGAAAALLAGCTTASPPASTSTPQATTSSPQATVSPVCAAADAYADALTGFKDALLPGATVEQVRAARDQVVKTYDDLVSAIGSGAQERMDAVCRPKTSSLRRSTISTTTPPSPRQPTPCGTKPQTSRPH